MISRYGIAYVSPALLIWFVVMFAIFLVVFFLYRSFVDVLLSLSVPFVLLHYASLIDI